jgi:hypothetical protein
MSEILDDKSQVLGEIYIITNTLNQKKYVGQTVSHRKNHHRYRPFGYMGRFRDHVSEALCNTKKKQCRYLNNAIRKHGTDAFTVELITTCTLAELDTMETWHISDSGTLFPQGYNLTKGGKTGSCLSSPKILEVASTHVKLPRTSVKSEATKQLISKRLKARFDDETKLDYMKQAQRQHYGKKLEVFKDVVIDQDVDRYITVQNSTRSGAFIHVKIGTHTTNFIGKHSTIEDLRQQAVDFINQLKMNALGNMLKLRETPKSSNYHPC